MSIFNNISNITPTKDQKTALSKIEEFLDGGNNVFILKGYAGSGKTTMIKIVADYLNDLKRSFFLMTPTGRAAKVLSEKTSYDAATIHRSIYTYNKLEETEISKDENDITYVYYFKVRKYDRINSVFIIDEASMVSDQKNQQEYLRFGSGKLLFDLIDFTRIKNPEANSKIIFVGDPAQLPPVDMHFSPALDIEYLNDEFNLKCQEIELKEIKRQTEESGILKAASRIRKGLTSGFYNDFDLRDNGKDLLSITDMDLLNIYKSCEKSKIVISYKNKTASELNSRIRKDKYGDDIPLTEGDTIIIGANNYKLQILNGEFGIVTKVGERPINRQVGIKNKGTIELSWRYIELIFPDGNEIKPAKGYLLENYLYSDTDLSQHERLALYIDFKNRFRDEFKNRGEKVPGAKSVEFKDALLKDPFYHATMLKFGYAITCNKAQGGEWNDVISIWDRGSIDDKSFYSVRQNEKGKSNKDFYRWAYTAITRSSKKLFCLNAPYFNSFSKMQFMTIEVNEAFKDLTVEQEIQSITLNNEHSKLFDNLGLNDENLNIQDHLIKTYEIVKKHYIDIDSWTRKSNYEFWIGFKRGNNGTTIKFTHKANYKISDWISKVSKESNSDKLFTEISQRYPEINNLIVSRNTAESILSKIEIEFERTETHPFLDILLEGLRFNCDRLSITIDQIIHNNYHERYVFIRGSEKAVLNFYYNDKGFFGKVYPIENQCNSKIFLDDLRGVVNNLKTQENVI